MSEVPDDIPENSGQVVHETLDSLPAESGSPLPDSQNTLWHSLREAREARGLTIAEVAHYLKFTPKQVEAMETGALKQLPGPAFTRGFVRNYARFLQLDVRPFMVALDPVGEDGSLQPPPPRLGNMPSTQTMARFPAWPALAATLGLLALVVAGWYFSWFEPRDEAFLADAYTQSDAAVASAPAAARSAPVATAAIVASAPVAASAPVVLDDQIAASAPAAAIKNAASAPVAAVAIAPSAASAPVQSKSVVTSPVVTHAANQSTPVAATTTLASEPVSSARKPLAGGQLRVVLGFNEEAWVEVRDASDKIIFSRLNEADSKQEIQGDAPLSFVIGNAQEVHLSYNGRAVDLTPYIKVNVARFTLP